MLNFLRLNRDYIEDFGRSVVRRFNDYEKRSETGFLKAILTEINELFRKIGGRIASKRMIPKPDEYPDSERYNRLLEDIGFDLDKIFNAQKIVESDINNLLNFNAGQRNRTFENLTTTQQLVYSAYVRAKRDILGGTEVPEGNPFTSADNAAPESTDIFIDESRSILTLDFDSQDDKSIDVRNTSIYFAGRMPERPVYPVADTMAIGSHWKKSSSDPHFIDAKNMATAETYKTMMIDDPNNNVGVGVCEFEAVETRSYGAVTSEIKRDNTLTFGRYGTPIVVPSESEYKSEASSIFLLREYIGASLGMDKELIYMDLPNSLQGEFVRQTAPPPATFKSTPQYRLAIPFTQTVPTNEIVVELSANANGFYPKVIWNESRAFSNVGGSDVAYELVPPRADVRDISPDGKYVCHIREFVIPSRLELVLEYESDDLMWLPIDFFVSYYVYSDQKTYEMPYLSSGQKVLITLRKSYDIFVDTEANENSERRRALNVLRTPGRSNA